MLDILLNILSVLGIALLVILALLAAVVLLVLFFPVTYRLQGRKDAENQELSVRLNWLFGFLRVRYTYPVPGVLTAKLLCFKLYRKELFADGKKKGPQKAGEKTDANGGQAQASGTMEASSPTGASSPLESSNPIEDSHPIEDLQHTEASSPIETSRPIEASHSIETSQPIEASSPIEASQTIETSQAIEASQPTEEANTSKGQDEEAGSGAPEPEEAPGQKSRDGFFEKIEKIKYTILNIYDKIKEIWKNISYYTALLQEEDTGRLFAHVKLRVFKILKSIRPRHIRADVLFGTGAPDTTGYAYGMYCMLSPFLGDKFLVTPDFERAVLEGNLKVSGHITVFVVLINAVRLLLDKKFHWFISRLKNAAPHPNAASHPNEASHHNEKPRTAAHGGKSPRKNGGGHPDGGGKRHNGDKQHSENNHRN